MTNLTTQYPGATAIEFGGRTIPVIEGTTVEATLSLLGVPAGAEIDFSPITKVVSVGVKAGSKGSDLWDDEGEGEGESEVEVEDEGEVEVEPVVQWALPKCNLSRDQILFVEQKEVDVTDAQALLGALKEYSEEAERFAKEFAQQFVDGELTAKELGSKLRTLGLV